MSKSLGNIVRVVELRQEYAPRALRYFLLSAHYRNPVSFSHEAIRQIENGLERFDTAVANLRHRMQTASEGDADQEVREELDRLTGEFEAAMDDDLNTANAISVLFEAVKSAQSMLSRPVLSKGSLIAYLDWLRRFGSEILGLIDMGEEEGLDQEIEALIEERQQARAVRDFQRADAIRDQLAAQGIILEDTPQGVRWRRK